MGRTFCAIVCGDSDLVLVAQLNMDFSAAIRQGIKSSSGRMALVKAGSSNFSVFSLDPMCGIMIFPMKIMALVRMDGSGSDCNLTKYLASLSILVGVKCLTKA
mmetsp:Transcript_8996/g.8579  ORF Transcript_8996/g.8579 Transcript_8996/m.8579 type:complete len:103 (-) Transcript_8996:108-416(-)